MSLIQFSILASICFVAMISPGPDFILVTRNALTLPKRQALATAFGIMTGCGVAATYCVLGLAIVITQSVLVFSVIKYAGACYLIYIGIKGLRSSSTRSSELFSSASVKKVSTYQAYIQGLLCNLLNPKLTIFLLSLFTQFISPNASLVEKIIVAGVFVLESSLYWPLLVFLLQSGAIRGLLERVQVYLDRICGAMLIALGMRVALERN